MSEVSEQTVVTLTEYKIPSVQQIGPVSLVGMQVCRDAEITQAYAPSEAEMAKSLGISRGMSQSKRDIITFEIIGTGEMVTIETDALIAAIAYLVDAEEGTE